MLDLPNILWVVPGVVFVHFYNKKRPHNNIDLAGWSYVFTLVLVAVLTWLPMQLLLSHLVTNTDPSEIWVQLLLVFCSSLFAIFILWFCREGTLVNRLVFSPVHDNFYNKCTTWENKAVFVTLKNDKAYIGTLWKYPENPQSKHESQTISIIPLASGYRVADKKIKWNTFYPKYTQKSDFINMEILIPRSEIITFGRLHNQTFQYFYPHSIESSASSRR